MITGNKTYVRKGQIQTRPRGESYKEAPEARRKRHNDRQNGAYKDTTKSGSFATKAMNEQKRVELGEKKGIRMTPYTREEWDAIRKEEEQVNLERLRKLREEYEVFEKQSRRTFKI